MKFIIKENLIVNREKKALLNRFKYEYKLPVAFINSYSKDRASRNIVGVRELVPENLFMEQFYLFLSIITLLVGIMVITSLNPIHSVFWLVLVFLNSSAILLLLGFSFVPLMLIIVYVGAIAILFLFVIMMLDILQLKRTESITNIIPIVICIFGNVLSYIYIYFKGNDLKLNINSYYSWYLNSESQISNISKLLYTYFSYPFIIISLLLLVAMVGAIVLVLDLGLITRRQSLTTQHQRLVIK